MEEIVCTLIESITGFLFNTNTMHHNLTQHAIEYGTWKPLSYWKGVDIEESRQEFELNGVVFTAIGYLPDYEYGGLEEEPYQEEAVVMVEIN